MAFQHPDPLQSASKVARLRVPAALGFYEIVTGVPGKRIKVKSWSTNNYGPGSNANFDIIDRLVGFDDILICEDYACADGRNTSESDDDGIADLREGASLVFRAKSGLVTHTRVNYWIV